VTCVIDGYWLVFAQAGGGAGGAGAGGSPWGMLPAFLLIGVVFYLLMLRPQRKEQAQRKTMLENLKKNDHVVTIGGIYGVVTNVRPEVDEVTLKVDETSNTKLRMTLASIARVVVDQPAAEQAAK
jgi:preprotein translocase subunit YajC